jgi:hypothetical protein
MTDTILVLCLIGMAVLISGGALVTSDDRDALGKILMAIGAWLSALGLVLLFYSMAFAMDGDDHGNKGELKEWFNGLQSDKGPCCSVSDGITITDSDWESVGNHYRVRVPRENPRVVHDGPMVWVEVPDDAVVKGPNRYMRTVVWPLYNAVQFGAHAPVIRCFMPGTMS